MGGLKMKLSCPVCNGKAEVLADHLMSDKSHELQFRCESRGCSHLFSGVLVLTVPGASGTEHLKHGQLSASQIQTDC